LRRGGRTLHVELCRDAAAAGALLAAHAGARHICVGEPVDLDSCADGTRLILTLATAPAAPLPQRAGAEV
jgi:hypothetical protein